VKTGNQEGLVRPGWARSGHSVPPNEGNEGGVGKKNKKWERTKRKKRGNDETVEEDTVKKPVWRQKWQTGPNSKRDGEKQNTSGKREFQKKPDRMVGARLVTGHG